jgi:hypothetical protein
MKARIETRKVGLLAEDRPERGEGLLTPKLRTPLGRSCGGDFDLGQLFLTPHRPRLR